MSPIPKYAEFVSCECGCASIVPKGQLMSLYVAIEPDGAKTFRHEIYTDQGVTYYYVKKSASISAK